METFTLNLEVETILQSILSQRRIPSATYRLQFNRQFTFGDAYDLIPYLHDLGITDCYASPLFKPRAGSTHGYDTADYGQLNPDLCSQQEFDDFVDRLHEHNMGLLLDIVPNHMGIGPDNAWWMDVLTHGPASPYASYFDINWQPPKRGLENKVLLPILEDHYGRVLETGKLRLEYDGNDYSLNYGDFRLPIAIGTCIEILRLCYQLVSERLPDEHEASLELQSLISALNHLPSYDDLKPESIRERLRDQIIIRRRLSTLHNNNSDIQYALDAAVKTFNGTPDDLASYDRLDELITSQPYRLAFWRVAGDEINYRRFFDINDMAAIRPEYPHVFQAVHRLLQHLLEEGKISGVRIDHPDGLWDPQAYFQQLQELYVSAQAARHTTSQALIDAVVGTFSSRFTKTDLIRHAWPLYIVVEKILSEIEPLPEDWPVNGTTGYDFMIAVNGIFVNRDHVHAFDDLYSRFIDKRFDFRELIYETKKLIMQQSLASEINSRSQQLLNIAERNRRTRGFTMNGLRFAITEIVACMSIYRTYITRLGMVSERDRFYVEEAVEQAKRRNPRVSERPFNFVRDTLLLQNIYDFDEDHRADLIEFVMQFQQITGPVMAKSVEDTAFYIYTRLLSLNEVGGNPEQFGIGLDDFHRHNTWHQQHWPHTLVGLSTHDTKRSADVRARLNVLSEIPNDWETAIWRWSDMNAFAKTSLDGELAPDRNDEFLLYQTLIGAWPLENDAPPEFKDRIAAYMHKAINEAKVHTSWTNTNERYDNAVDTFVSRILENDQFVNDIARFQERTSFYGQFNSLSQTLLSLTAPGVPDTYQGNELWDLSLVDPDNRRPVDYELRRRYLSELNQTAEIERTALARDLLKTSQDGRIKLYLTSQALNFRRRNIDLFQDGSYIALEAQGNKARHVCGFMRVQGDKHAVIIAPVLVVALTDGVQRPPVGEQIWQNTHLLLPDARPGQQYRDIFTGQVLNVVMHDDVAVLRLSDVLNQFPVALLEQI